MSSPVLSGQFWRRLAVTVLSCPKNSGLCPPAHAGSPTAVSAV